MGPPRDGAGPREFNPDGAKSNQRGNNDDDENDRAEPMIIDATSRTERGGMRGRGDMQMRGRGRGMGDSMRGGPGEGRGAFRGDFNGGPGSNRGDFRGGYERRGGDFNSRGDFGGGRGDFGGNRGDFRGGYGGRGGLRGGPPIAPFDTTRPSFEPTDNGDMTT